MLIQSILLLNPDKEKSIETIKWFFVLLNAFALFYVLYILEAFGIQQGLSFSNHSYAERCFYYMLAIGFVFYMIEFILFQKKIPKTVIAIIFNAIIYLVVGGSVLFLQFNYFWNWSEWTFSAYFLLLGEYSAVIAFPVLIYFFLCMNHKPVVASDRFLTFSSANGKDQLVILPTDFLFLKSAGNYVEIYYRNNALLKKKMLRNTLKKIKESHYQHASIQQCQRSYLINPSQIQKKTQKGDKLMVQIDTFEIPVSSTFQDKI